MFLANTFGLMYNAEKQWKAIADNKEGIITTYLKYLIWIALIPPFSAYVGSTYIGWNLGVGETIRLTTESAALLSVVAYFAILVAVLILGFFIKWMAVTYGAEPTLRRCFRLAAYTCSPLFLVGFVGMYPILWLDLLASLVAVGFAVFLLYTGVPVMMEIDKDRGFLFSSSVLTVCLVVLVGMLAFTAIFWGSGFAPIFVK